MAALGRGVPKKTMEQVDSFMMKPEDSACGKLYQGVIKLYGNEN